ncbi:MAG: hypothetical protein H6719_09600 [Sandaracinaceae bacterium]|nr:hypothetical protein [Sandaracinaceae bacterium]
MTSPSAVSTALFRHSRREVWGLGTVVQALDDRLRMQFQDGRTRTFKKGYYHLLDAVDRPLDVTLAIVTALRNMADGGSTPKGAGGRMPPSLEEQIAYFAELFEDGFLSESYAEQHRGDGRKRPLKRHRDAMVTAAAEGLGAKVLQRRLAADEHTAVHAAASSVLALTDLVSAKERKAFAEIDPSHHAAVASSLHALLHGKSKIAVRIDGYVASLERALGEAPSWELTTVLLGAVHPATHLVMRTSPLTLQAAWMAPGLMLSGRPMGLLYERFHAMTMRVDEALREAGHEPRDLLDVCDFMWMTLKPAARERIFERRGAYGVGAPKVAGAKDDQAAA